MLNQFSIIKTSIPDEMAAIVSTVFGGSELNFPNGTHGFQGEGAHVQVGSVGVSYCHYASTTTLKFSEQASIRLQVVLAARGATTVGRESLEISNRRSCIIPANVPPNVRFEAHFKQLVLHVEAKALERKFIEIVGDRPRTPIQFDSSVDLLSCRAASLRRKIIFFANELNTLGKSLDPLLLAELEQLYLISFLYSAHHNYTELLRIPPRAAAPWQVGLVEEYIESNWNRPISIKELAAVTNASVRSIFSTFKKSRGYSPMMFLKAVRLQHARNRLRSPEVGTTVGQVALACGFLSLGHFSREYAEAFGELPSLTLARSKGRRDEDNGY